jgi:hypothetical protein
MRGLLDGLISIPAIMKEQGCTWDEAERLWVISMQVEAENAKPEIVFLQDPLDIADRVAAQMGVDVEEAIFQMESCDIEAVRQFHVGNSLPKEMIN